MLVHLARHKLRKPCEVNPFSRPATTNSAPAHHISPLAWRLLHAYEYRSRPCSIPLIGRPAPTSGLPFRPPPSDLMRHVPCFLSANRSFVVMPLKPIVTRNKVPDSLAAGPWAADRL
ncbi:hypothetical protein A9K55_001010 [Cordyceps militaris]|uniref:Uncharacterized protein n=1 Tax=Cordyceps militaris TaxID=73501 RepID=A0A2H4STE6_CORMI|nr:hypothetical protein A9K55_001010 [Cordyceps militaris]